MCRIRDEPSNANDGEKILKSNSVYGTRRPRKTNKQRRKRSDVYSASFQPETLLVAVEIGVTYRPLFGAFLVVGCKGNGKERNRRYAARSTLSHSRTQRSESD